VLFIKATEIAEKQMEIVQKHALENDAADLFFAYLIALQKCTQTALRMYTHNEIMGLITKAQKRSQEHEPSNQRENSANHKSY